MELEKLEVIIEANMEQVEKQLDALRNKFTGFFDKIDALSSGMGNKVEKNMDISKGQKKMLDQLEKINQAIKDMSDKADKQSKGTGEKVGANISNGIGKARTQVKKDLDGVVSDIQDKLTVARALQNKITVLRGQREQYRSDNNASKVADVDLKIAKAQQEMNKLRSTAKATAEAMKREFESVPSSLKSIENEMAINEAKIESMRKRIASLNAQRNAQKSPIGSFSSGFRYVDNEQSMKTAEAIRKQSMAMDKLIAKNDALQQVYAATEDRAKALAKALEMLNNRSSGKIAEPMQQEMPKTPTRAIPKFGGVSRRTSNAIAHGWQRLPKIFSATGRALSAFGRLHRNVTNRVGGDYRAMNSSMAAWRLSLRFLIPSLVIYNLLGAAIRNMTKGLIAALGTNAQFASSLNQIKVNLLTAFYPIYEAVLPAINAMMNALAVLTGKMAAFMSMLFGKTFAQSKAGAQGLYNNVKAMDATGSSAKKATEKAKELQRTLMGFDQINKLDAKTDNPDSGSSGGGGGASEPTLDFNTPDYPVPDWLKYFKPILDAWDTTGQKVMDAWKYALGEIKGLIGAIGKSLNEVWNNGSGQALFEQIFMWLANILNIIGDIAKAFRLAWEDNGRGTALIQSIFDMFTKILGLLNEIAVSFRNAFNDGVGVAIATNILEIFTNIFNTIGNIAERLRIAWEANNTGQKIFEAILGIINDILSHINSATKATSDWAKTLDFTPLLTSIETLLQAIRPLADNIGSGLEWFYKNVLLPLGKFTIEKIIPDFINILAKAIEVIDKIINAAKPAFEWLWDNFLKPIAKWTGGVADKALKAIADALDGIGKFIDAHQEGLSNLLTFMIGFVGALKVLSFIGTVVEVLSGIFTFLSSIGGLSGLLAAVGEAIGAIVAVLGGPITIAIAAAIGAGVLLWKNWDTVKEKATELGQWLGEKWDDIKKATSEAWDNVKKATSDKWTEIKKSVSDTASKAVENVKSNWDTMMKNTSQAWSDIKKDTSKWWEDTKTTVSNMATKAVDNVKSNWKTMSDETSKSWTQLKNDTSRSWENLKSTISDKASGAWRTVQGKWSDISSTTSSAWSGIKSTTSYAWDNVSSKVSNAAQTAVSNVASHWETLKSISRQAFDKVGSWASGIGDTIGRGLRSGVYAVQRGAAAIGNGIVGVIGKAVNGVIDGINWVLSKVNSGHRLSRWWVPQYANGTTSHGGGLALVNDAQGENYQEAYRLPNGQTGLFPRQRNMLVNLPKGTQVLDGKRTANLFGLPKYAKGIFGSDFLKDFKFNFNFKMPKFNFGSFDFNIPTFNFGNLFSGASNFVSNAWDTVQDVASEALSFLSNPSKLFSTVVNKFVNLGGALEPALSIAKGGIQTMSSGVIDYFKGLYAKEKKRLEDEARVSYNPSAGVEQWRPVVRKALRMLGMSGKHNEDLTLFQMQTESGGNPNAINNWDINARNGDPSRGLMQVIGSTFRAYAYPGYNRNIYDPLSNILAALRYAKARYGSLDRAFRGVGYANGGLVEKEGLYRLAEGNKREMVIPLEKSDRALGLIMEALDFLGAKNMNNYAMPEVFDLPTPTPIATSTSYNGGGMQQFSDNLMNQLMLMFNGFGKVSQAPTGDIVIYIGGTEFGRIAVSEINKYHEKLGRIELNV